MWRHLSRQSPAHVLQERAKTLLVATELDLSSLKREELHLLSLEELDALDELAYGGVMQGALEAEEAAAEAAAYADATRNDLALAQAMQDMLDDEADEEEALEEAAEEDWQEDWEDAEDEAQERRQVERAMHLTDEQAQEREEWRQVELAMMMAEQQEQQAAAGVLSPREVRLRAAATPCRGASPRAQAATAPLVGFH